MNSLLLISPDHGSGFKPILSGKQGKRKKKKGKRKKEKAKN
ncbi:hypothetical protein QUA40_00285 [Microcoleus sp. Pol11C3]